MSCHSGANRYLRSALNDTLLMCDCEIIKTALMKSTKVQTLGAYYFAHVYIANVRTCNREYAEVARCVLVDAES